MKANLRIAALAAGAIIFSGIPAAYAETGSGANNSKVKAIIAVIPGQNWSQPFSTSSFSGKTIPQMVIWVEKPDGTFLDTLWITRKFGTQQWAGKWPGKADEITFRKDSLPYWMHKRAAAGFPSPTLRTPLPDSVTAATPASGLTFETSIPALGGEVDVLLEVNNSFDGNATYPVETPDPEALYNGQPALVFRARVNTGRPGRYKMELLGHSSWNGENGELATDLKGITTAAGIVGSAEVAVE